MHTAQINTQKRVAIIGGGWAGMAAAVYATQAGHAVTVFEAAPQWGGRARSVTLPWPDGPDRPDRPDGPDGQNGSAPLTLDNGQHILIGAYSATFDLMRRVGADPAQAFLRLPLALRFADGHGLALPDWHTHRLAGLLARLPGLDAAWGIATTRGWPWADRLALLRAARRWQAMGFACPPACSVAQLCEGLSPRLMDEFIDPLCVSALNTPAHEASGQIFLRVLRDSLMGADDASEQSPYPTLAATPGPPLAAPSNLMLPRQPMGALWCEHAARWLTQHGAQLRLGQPVQALAQADTGAWLVNGEAFAQVIIATSAPPAARLLSQLSQLSPLQQQAPGIAHWCSTAQALRHEAITTVYARAEPDHTSANSPYHLPMPMLALRANAQHPAQFVFERDRIHNGHAHAHEQASPQAPRTHALAFVVSASRWGRDELAHAITAQAQAELGLRVSPVHVLTDKRATFCCTPGLQRPPMRIAPGLLACGDYIDGPYPATLEGAVRSAAAAVAALHTAQPGPG